MTTRLSEESRLNDARKWLEQELAVANDRLHLAMAAGKSVGWDWDVRSGRDHWFGDLETIFGIPGNNYVGKVDEFHRRVHPDDLGHVWKAVQVSMHSGTQYGAEFRIVRPDGNVRWVAAQGKFYYAPDGTAERMLGMAVDITDRVLAEQALRENEERLRLAAGVGRMYAYEWNRESDIIVRSGEFTRILGLTDEPQDPTCQQMFTTVHTDDRAHVLAATNACTPQNPFCRVAYRVLRPDGSVVWLEKHGHAFFDEKGRMERMIGMVADITEKKIAEEALSSLSRRLIEAQEAERARIARDLHDDIGQQLALLAITLGRIDVDSANPVNGLHLNDVRRQVAEISSSVRDLSHELHSSALRLLDLEEALKSFCRELSEKQSVEIQFLGKDVPKDMPEDISLCLFRVLQEALHNAVKYSGVKRFEVNLQGTAEAVDLTIRDSGFGFDPDAPVKGHGLGLISMGERLKLVRGTLTIHAQPGRGTTIHASVPVAVRKPSIRTASAGS